MATGSGVPAPNLAIYNARDARGETQEQTAEALNQLARQRGQTTAITGNHISRWERGIVRPGRLSCQLLAEHFHMSLDDLGLMRQRIPRQTSQTSSPAGLFLIEEAETSEATQQMLDSQHAWLATRRALNANHQRLAMAAAQLYPEGRSEEPTGLLIRPEWMWPDPVDLDAISIRYSPDEAAPAITGSEETSSQVRPLRADGHRYARYSHAIRDVAQPTLFENRYSWRLTGVQLGDDGGELRFGDMNYFEAMDTCEAVAHETTSHHVREDGSVAPSSWTGLRLRRAIGDPFDLARRPVLLSINTLTIRRDRTGATVVLHSRNPANVATSGGVIGVMPAGVFQPSTVRAGDHNADFNLWRNIMREYSEEFLGNPEHNGDGQGANYDDEPFKSLDAARRDGHLRIYGVGIALGALDLWAGLETIAVIDADTFDDLFAGLVSVNEEGTVVRMGHSKPTVHVPLTAGVIDELWASGRLAPETAFSLRTAWLHRDRLLANP